MNKGQKFVGEVIHGLRDHPLYPIWSEMKQRCYNKNHKNYNYYGGRGIKVCSRWLDSFPNFLLDMGHRAEGLSIDRVDNDGNYEPYNCQWASMSEQAINKRIRVDNKSGVAGVTWDNWSGSWKASYKNRTLGRTKDFFEACCLRKSAEVL